MPEDLASALAELKPLLLDRDHLIRAVAAGRRRGESPSVRRAEIRPVDLRKKGRVLQVVTFDDYRATTQNTPYGAAHAVVDSLLREPFGSWHIETTDTTIQMRVTKKGAAAVHRSGTSRRDVAVRAHDRAPRQLLDPDDPIFTVLGAGADKRRQVDAFLRLLKPVVPVFPKDRPLRVVDLGCGNAYLTFAAHRYLSSGVTQGPPTTGESLAGLVRTAGVDERPDMLQRNEKLARDIGMPGLTFQVGAIADCVPFSGGATPDLVLALHACDTATDDAIARAVRWKAPVILAAPCCHHDIQRQLAQGPGAPMPYTAMARQPILRERFADVLTDTLRALVLRALGYRTDVVEFVDSRHTPRNALIRAVYTGAPARPELLQEYRALSADWSVHPALARLLDKELTAVLLR
ncbi:MAG: class I SAM-dependent methyltransferase [Actinomycetota bacterium]